jgi:hypothetical protein
MLRPVRRKHAALLSAMLVAVSFLVSCRGADAMRQRCLAGEAADCEGACKKGVSGEGGCFHAAEHYRELASLDFKSEAFRKASGYFQRACDGKYADGCLFAAQMIEAPYAAVDDADSSELPPLMVDTQIVDREERLGRACELGSAAGCKRLGDVLAGKSAERANAAYAKACSLGKDAAACTESRAHDVAVFERYRASCTHGVADDCTTLGKLLFAVDPPRAARLFVSECELRGVADVAGGVGRFVRQRVRQARAGAEADVPTTTIPGGPAFSVTTGTVQGKLAFLEADRALKQRASVLGSCAAGAPNLTSGTAKLHLVVDLTGDVYRADVVEGNLPPAVVACVVRSLEGVTMSAPGGELAMVDATIDVTSAAH